MWQHKENAFTELNMNETNSSSDGRSSCGSVYSQRSEVSTTHFTHIPFGHAKWTHPSRVPSMAARGDRWWGLPRSRSSRCCRDDRSAAEAEARFGVGDRSSTEVLWWWLLEPLYRPDVQTQIIQWNRATAHNKLKQCLSDGMLLHFHSIKEVWKTKFSLLLLFVTSSSVQLLSYVNGLICHFKKQLKTPSKVNLYKLEHPLLGNRWNYINTINEARGNSK